MDKPNSRRDPAPNKEPISGKDSRSPQQSRGLWKILDFLPEKIRRFLINRETILYVVFGVLTTVVSYVVGLLCYYTLPLAPESPLLNLVSNCISWVAAVIFAFITNKIFVFESKSWSAKVLLHEIPTFLSARLLSLGVELLGMWLLVDCAHILYEISKLLMNVLVILINYVLSKLVIFKKKA